MSKSLKNGPPQRTLKHTETTLEDTPPPQPPTTNKNPQVTVEPLLDDFQMMSKNLSKTLVRSLRHILGFTPLHDRGGGLIRSSLTSCGNKAKVQQFYSDISYADYLRKRCHNLLHAKGIFRALIINVLLNQTRYIDKAGVSVSSKCSINNPLQERVFANPQGFVPASHLACIRKVNFVQ